MATIDDLTFTLSSDGTYYSVKATSTSISGDLEIPAEYNGLHVMIIDSHSFTNCSGLTSITIPSSVTTIGDYAFFDCDGLTSITIPPSVTSIGERAFFSCEGLTSVTIPESVTTIGKYAFAYCWAVISITIPSSVTSIGYSAFFSCSYLKYFKFEGNAISASTEVLKDTPNLSCVHVNAGTTGWGATWGGKTIVVDGALVNSVKFGDVDVSSVFYGDLSVGRIYFGDQVIY